MNQISLSDDALAQAAAAVRQSMLDSLPPPSRCEHTFSDLFQARMKQLLSRYSLRRTVRKAAQRVAAVVLAALIGTGAWLTVDTEAREVFFSWVREVYEEHIVYRFFGEPAAETLPAYRITWLPEGYTEVDAHEGKAAFNAFYQKGDDVMSGFVFEYSFMHNSGYLEMEIGSTNYNRKTVVINSIQADFYLASNPEETNNLIWFDENTDLVFTLNGFLEESVMVHIAESIVLADPTK